MPNTKRGFGGVGIIIIVLLALGVGAYFWSQKKSVPPIQSVANSTGSLRPDLRCQDSINISQFKIIPSLLGIYFEKYKVYPETLSKLGDSSGAIIKDSSSNKYLYAYYPKVKPTSYHLGLLLEGCSKDPVKQVVDKEFLKDRDFNSATAGYVNGFDGKDPIYDLAS